MAPMIHPAAHTPDLIVLPYPDVAGHRCPGLAGAGALSVTGPPTSDQYSKYGVP